MVLPLTNPAFRAYILFYSWYYFSVMIITPFLMVYMLNYLKISYATIALLTNMGTLAVFFSATIWGRLIDKFSPKSVLKLCYPAMCLLIPLLLLATPGNFLILYLFHFLAGLFSCGLNLSLTNTVLRIAPDEHASAYFAAENAIVSLAGTAGPLLGGWLAQSVQGVQTHLGGLTIVHLHFVFLAAMAVRLCGFFLLRRLREPRERDVGHMLRVMRRVPGLRPMGATRSAVDALVALLHPLIRRSRSHTPLPPRPHPDDEPPLEDQDKSDDR
jgi:MFS family permease